MPNTEELTGVNSIYSSNDEEAIEVEEVGNEPKISSLEDATRFAYGLAKTRESINELEEVAKKEIDKWERKINEVKEWLESVTTPLKNKEEYLANQLQVFHVNQFNAAKNDSERKKVTSIKLPYGVTLKSRAVPYKLEVTDEEVYKKYAQENKYLKAPKEPEVDWSTLKKNIVVNNDGRVLNKETGEFLDFITVVPQERKFEVK